MTKRKYIVVQAQAIPGGRAPRRLSAAQAIQAKLLVETSCQKMCIRPKLLVETSCQENCVINVREPTSWNNVRTLFGDTTGLWLFENFILEYEGDVDRRTERFYECPEEPT